jgi:hypothetical protein
VLVERDGKQLRLTPLLTRNPILTTTSGFGMEQVPDPPPPVDLEKELRPEDAPQTTQRKSLLIENFLDAPAPPPDDEPDK